MQFYRSRFIFGDPPWDAAQAHRESLAALVNDLSAAAVKKRVEAAFADTSTPSLGAPWPRITTRRRKRSADLLGGSNPRFGSHSPRAKPVLPLVRSRHNEIPSRQVWKRPRRNG